MRKVILLIDYIDFYLFKDKHDRPKITKDSMHDFMSSRRSRSVARPRQIAMYLSKKMTTKSLPDIGRRFSGRDHTTVIHAIKKVEESDKKAEATEAELAASKEMLPPLMTKAQELEAVKAAFSSGTVLKDLEAAYAKEKKGLSPERQLGLAGLRLLTNGTKDPATVEAFQKALEMTDWKSQQKVICAAQNALAAAGEKVKVMSECGPEASNAKGDNKADAKDAAHSKGDKKDAHGSGEKHAAHWEYEGAMGPENWGKEFATCGRGKSQAPLQ